MDEIINRLHRIADIEFDGNFDEIADELEEMKEWMILDIDSFKRELERQHLMTNKLNEFIDDYMRWNNK